MIFCEFNYCVYNEKSECVLKNASISPLGFCDNCIMPTIDEKDLEKYKKETLKSLERGD